MTFHLYGSKGVSSVVVATVDGTNHPVTDLGSAYDLVLSSAQESALPNPVAASVNDGTTTKSGTFYLQGTEPDDLPPTFGTITLTGNQLEINWVSNKAGRKFDVHLSTNSQPSNDATVSNNLGDSVGIGAVETHTFTITQTGTYTAYLRIRYSDNDWEDTPTTVADGRYIDTTVAIDIDAPVSGTTLANVVDLSGGLISQGSWTTQDWIDIVGLQPHYPPANMQYLSLVSDGGANWIRQQHVAASNGSARVIGPMDLVTRGKNMKVKQTLKLDSNFSWGTASFSGKLGFGIGAGVNTTGGSVNDAGCTLRISWDAGGELASYGYNVWPPSDNEPYGQETGTGFFITPGVEFVVELEAQMNSTFAANDGWFKVWVNGELRIHLTGLGWYRTAFSGESTPLWDRFTYSEFHGGDDSDWSPTETTGSQVKEVSWEVL